LFEKHIPHLDNEKQIALVHLIKIAKSSNGISANSALPHSWPIVRHLKKFTLWPHMWVLRRYPLWVGQFCLNLQVRQFWGVISRLIGDDRYWDAGSGNNLFLVQNMRKGTFMRSNETLLILITEGNTLTQFCDGLWFYHDFDALVNKSLNIDSLKWSVDQSNTDMQFTDGFLTYDSDQLRQKQCQINIKSSVEEITRLAIQGRNENENEAMRVRICPRLNNSVLQQSLYRDAQPDCERCAVIPHSEYHTTF
jgi:hypothetical protein